MSFKYDPYYLEMQAFTVCIYPCLSTESVLWNSHLQYGYPYFQTYSQMMSIDCISVRLHSDRIICFQSVNTVS